MCTILRDTFRGNRKPSSMERMLEALERKDKQPSDTPPALPMRPTSKARLPSSVRAKNYGKVPQTCSTVQSKEQSKGTGAVEKKVNEWEFHFSFGRTGGHLYRKGERDSANPFHGIFSRDVPKAKVDHASPVQEKHTNVRSSESRSELLHAAQVPLQEQLKPTSKLGEGVHDTHGHLCKKKHERSKESGIDSVSLHVPHVPLQKRQKRKSRNDKGVDECDGHQEKHEASESYKVDSAPLPKSQVPLQGQLKITSKMNEGFHKSNRYLFEEKHEVSKGSGSDSVSLRVSEASSHKKLKETSKISERPHENNGHLACGQLHQKQKKVALSDLHCNESDGHQEEHEASESYKVDSVPLHISQAPLQVQIKETSKMNEGVHRSNRYLFEEKHEVSKGSGSDSVALPISEVSSHKKIKETNKISERLHENSGHLACGQLHRKQKKTALSDLHCNESDGHQEKHEASESYKVGSVPLHISQVPLQGQLKETSKMNEGVHKSNGYLFEEKHEVSKGFGSDSVSLRVSEVFSQKKLKETSKISERPHDNNGQLACGQLQRKQKKATLFDLHCNESDSHQEKHEASESYKVDSVPLHISQVPLQGQRKETRKMNEGVHKSNRYLFEEKYEVSKGSGSDSVSLRVSEVSSHKKLKETSKISERPHENNGQLACDQLHRKQKKAALSDLHCNSIYNEESCEKSPCKMNQEAFNRDQSGSIPSHVSCHISVPKNSGKQNCFKNENEINVPSIQKDPQSWCMFSDSKWALGTLQASVRTESVVHLSDGKIMQVPTNRLLGANPEIIDGIDDLIKLSYLSEPSIIHNIQQRYIQDKIYTRAGPVLVAINPFKDVPLYGNEYIEAYRHKSINNPHVYQMANAAFEAMTRDGVNQSIVISGESGAGKTETAKKAMEYLSHLGIGGGIENRIIQTNPILEAFGNAKTSRNKNSSRFGKLIDIHFDDCGRICGAKIQTYLLEKSRVVHQVQGERSYHIFYQFCAGASPSLREHLNLMPAERYHYLNQSGCLTIDGMDDAKAFQEVMDALVAINISKEDQESVFSMLASVLWLGNIEFTVMETENSVEILNNGAAKHVAKFLGCKEASLIKALTTRTIHAGNEDIIQRLTKTQAIDTRDALAKAIYACLFEWLIENMNKSLQVGKRPMKRSISILDIYGFESFEKNSFEQLCINYANERLQQHFNWLLLKLEQEEYALNGINWTKVDFEDNQECLDLIEKKPFGIFSLLDEECTFPEGSDLTLLYKLKQHLRANSCFKGERGRCFTVRHYAGEVTYDTNTFLEKNRDLLHSDLIQLLSTCSGLPKLFASELGKVEQKLENPRRRGRSKAEQSVATKFKGQLVNLMKSLESTSPHFIRCIKPNKFSKAGVYDQGLVLQQLRSCGISEVVRIYRSGYPERIPHENFANRYGFLLPSHEANRNALSVSVSVLQKFGIMPERYQIGITKLFFRTGQLAKLEDIRAKALAGIIGFQKLYRGYRARLLFQQDKSIITYLQSYIRGENSRRGYPILLQRQAAAMTIQGFLRQRVAQKKFTEKRNLVIILQSAIRGCLARKRLNTLQNSDEEMPHVKVVVQESISDRRLITQAPKVAPTRKKRLPFRELKESQNDSTIRVEASYLVDLQRRLLEAERTVRRKEDENLILQQRLYRLETAMADYKAQMNSMKEMWQKQLSVVAAKKSSVDEPVNYPTARPDYGTLRTRASKPIAVWDDEEFDWDDSTTVRSVANKISDDYRPPSYHSDSDMAREMDTGWAVVSQLMKEFEHRTDVFNADLDFIEDIKFSQMRIESNLILNPDEELNKLRQRVERWKTDFKARMRETKHFLQRIGNEHSSADKIRKKWWVKRARSAK